MFQLCLKASDFPLGMVALLRSERWIGNRWEPAVYLWYLSGVPATATAGQGQPRLLTAAALDIAVTVSLNGPAFGRLWLHAVPEGGDRLLRWYRNMGLDHVPGDVRFPQPRVVTTPERRTLFPVEPADGRDLLHESGRVSIMPTPAQAFAAVVADIDPADRGAVQRFYGEGLASYPPAARSLIADFRIGLSDLPSADELQALKATLARPAGQLPALDVPRRPRKPASTRPRRPATHAPQQIDITVGGRLRQRRMSLGMSEQQLAVALGLTVRQVEHYERGDLGLSVATLDAISRVLDVPVGFFFPSRPAPRQFGFAEEVTAFGDGAASSVDDGHAELLQAYDPIPDPAGRRRALALLSFLRSEKA